MPEPTMHFSEVLKTIQILMHKGYDSSNSEQQQYLVSVAEKNKRNFFCETQGNIDGNAHQINALNRAVIFHCRLKYRRRSVFCAPKIFG